MGIECRYALRRVRKRCGSVIIRHGSVADSLNWSRIPFFKVRAHFQQAREKRRALELAMSID